VSRAVQASVLRTPAPGPRVHEPDVSVVVPCLNEEDTLEATLDELVGVLRAAAFSWEVIVVDDGSRDRSAQIALSYAQREPQVGVVRHATNMGSGQGIWTGIEFARGEFVIYVPADGQFDHAEIPMFVARAKEGADIVIGARLSRDDYTLYRQVSSTVFLWLCNTLFEHQFQDVNWVHLWRRSIFSEIEPRSRGVFFLEEILVRARGNGKRVVEVPSVYRPRQGGQAKGGRPDVIAKTIWEMLKLWQERHPRLGKGTGGKPPLC
jgi:glycosyltransferase involved in cell wall biosynthesis